MTNTKKADAKRAARVQAALKAKGERACTCCGLYGNVDHDSDSGICRPCEDKIQGENDGYDGCTQH